MNNDITQLLIIAYALVPFVNALVGLIKKTFPKLQSNFIPMIALVAGIILGIVFALLPNVNYSIMQMVLAGGIAGMSSCGVYQLAINTASKDSIAPKNVDTTPKEQ